MSRQRRESHGLGRIFSQPDIQATPANANAKVRGRASILKQRTPNALHDAIWDGPSNTTKITKTNRRVSMQTPIHQTGMINDIAAKVYGLLIEHDFQQKVGGVIPPNYAKPPMNSDIKKMFEFLYAMIDPGRERIDILTMMDNLQYPGLDQRLTRVFSNQFLLANTDTIWPSVLRALNYLAEIVISSSTAIIQPTANRDIQEQQGIAMISSQYIYAKYSGWSNQPQSILEKYLNEVAGSIETLANGNKFSRAKLTDIEEECSKMRAAKEEQAACASDAKNIKAYIASYPLQISQTEAELEDVNLKIITAQEEEKHLNQKKIASERRFNDKKFDLESMEEYRHLGSTYNTDLSRLRQKIVELETEITSRRIKIAETRTRIQIPLENVCEELGTVVPDETEWSKAVHQLLRTVDERRRQLTLENSKMQQELTDEKIATASFNGQLEGMLAKKKRLEEVAKSVEEANTFKIKELEYKARITGERIEHMKKHCQELLQQSQREGTAVREQHLKLEHLGVKLEGKAISSMSSITSKTREKLLALQAAQDALLPSLRVFTSRAEAYSKLAAGVSRVVYKHKLPEPLSLDETVDTRVNKLMKLWENSLNSVP